MDVSSLTDLTQEDIDTLENTVQGIQYIRNFITKEEEQLLTEEIDRAGWSDDIRRRTQQYGAKFDYRCVTYLEAWR